MPIRVGTEEFRLKYLSVKDFESFQHYRDRRPPWIKLYRDLWRDPRFFELNETERYFLLTFFVIASQNDNRIPDNQNWLKHEMATSKTVPVERLIELGWIEYASESAQPSAEGWASRYVSTELRLSIFERDGNACVTCGSVENLEVDHIIPISRGGSGVKDNLQLLCRTCNRKKRVRLNDARQMLDRCSTTSDDHSIVETEKRQRREETEKDTEAERAPVENSVFGEFHSVKLTAEEYGKLELRIGEPLSGLIVELDMYSQTHPKQFKGYKNHYAVLMTWWNRRQANGNGSKAQDSFPVHKHTAACKDFGSCPDGRREYADALHRQVKGNA